MADNPGRARFTGIHLQIEGSSDRWLDPPDFTGWLLMRYPLLFVQAVSIGASCRVDGLWDTYPLLDGIDPQSGCPAAKYGRSRYDLTSSLYTIWAGGRGRPPSGCPRAVCLADA